MNTIITFVILVFFLNLTYNIIIFFKDVKTDRLCKTNIIYMPIPDVIENEFNLKYN